jgi:hypothetical protein
MSNVAFENMRSLMRELSTAEKIRLIEELAATLGRELPETKPVPKRSLLGAYADLGKAPTAEEIDEARQEAWKNFPREDFFQQ